MPDERKPPKNPIPTGWAQRGARLAGQTGRSAARFLGTRMKSFASPANAQDYLDSFHQKTAQQIVGMLGEMKGAAMKLGQLASFYEFAGGNEYLETYRDAMTMLQNHAPPMDPEASKQVIREEFGEPVDKVFASFDDEAIAAASIGQVHRATLPTGEAVAVKVQYPGVDDAVRADLKNVSALTKLSVAIAPNLDPKEVAQEVRDRVLEELDYRREASNQEKFAELYRDHPFIVVPKVHQDYCRTRVITQEFVEGEPFLTSFDWPQQDKDRLAETLFRFFYGSFNRFLLFSADPHPGNYLLLPDGKVAFLDFGLVRAIDPGTRMLFLEIIQGLINDDKDRCRSALEGIGILSPRTPEVDAVWDHLLMINKPVLEDREFTIDVNVVQEVASAGFDPRSRAFQTLRKVGIPGVMITFNRMSFGVASLLGRLGATANWQAIAREMWAGEPSQTVLGKQEEAWLKEVHPDFVPPMEPEP
ncbi:MAG TPA: AarF/ABC1/UbiB kinase family protein [Actinomycetota bacterium]|jgi:predicted unusual protein kinase regulating ubiquinone biosynthesis (AarF/ABC1/UbiB family)